jgi:Raf kinase inhibitor-like YbhB/YbcL family protein
MKLSSRAFKDGQSIPIRHTCDGKDSSPPLEIENVPSAAKSLVLVMDDPDSPSGTFLHWMLWNIDPGTIGIPEGMSPPRAAQGINDFGSAGYGGPCPNHGEHKYRFKLYALDATLNLKPSIKKEDLEIAMEGHICGQAELAGFYKRKGQ